MNDPHQTIQSPTGNHPDRTLPTQNVEEPFKHVEYAFPPLLRCMVTAGHHGRKTGRGYSDYTREKSA